MVKLTPRIPLSISESDGAYDMVDSYPELVKQNLKILVLTNPGEKPMDSFFGVGLKLFLFENDPNGNIVASNIVSKIYEQTGTYIPYISINEIDIRNLEENSINLTIYYHVTPLGLNDTLNVDYVIDEIWR